ncbi:hypothetical protein [Streptomyces sp. NPDC057682]|uniref:hypothetical protein n=1 Tax=Streptomyces sp. NPDC057682 TaxID=3346210 RepID=UPI0036A7C52F
MDAMSSRALSCVTALRLGGAVYILAEAAGQEDLYHQADAGVRAGLRSCEGRRPNGDVLRIAKKACRRLSTEFSGAEDTRPFALGGFTLMEEVLASIEDGDSRVAEPHIAVFDKALEVAALWPGPVDVDGCAGLREFEQRCQRESVDRLNAEGIPGLRSALGPRQLTYRDLARSASGR